MEKMTFRSLQNDAAIHLNHLVSTSKNTEELLFRLSGFYGGLDIVLRKKYPVNYTRSTTDSTPPQAAKGDPNLTTNT